MEPARQCHEISECTITSKLRTRHNAMKFQSAVLLPKCERIRLSVFVFDVNPFFTFKARSAIVFLGRCSVDLILVLSSLSRLDPAIPFLSKCSVDARLSVIRCTVAVQPCNGSSILPNLQCQDCPECATISQELSTPWPANVLESPFGRLFWKVFVGR